MRRVHTRIKICGITRTEDALLAAELGADAIGLVFVPESPRCISSIKAQEITQALPPFVTVTGLFADAEKHAIEKILEQVPIDLLQFHGNESPDFCEGFARPYIKTIHMHDEVDVLAMAAKYKTARGIVLDTYHPQQKGGTGQTFAWTLIPKNFSQPLLLAGGLKPDNVAVAIQVVRPYAVDVSSGIESKPGIKDKEKLTAFIEQVRNS